MKTKISLSLAFFAMALTFFACSSESPSSPQGWEGPSSSSNDNSNKRACQIYDAESGTINQCKQLKQLYVFPEGECETSNRQLVSQCNTDYYVLKCNCYDSEIYIYKNGINCGPCSSGGSNLPTCGNVEYNPVTQICSNNTISSKCGDLGYNPSTQFCSSSAVYTKCGNMEYNPSTQFCSSNSVYNKCGGTLTYSPGTEQCCGSNKYTTATQFCSSNSVYSKCGGKEYNPSTQECTDGIAFSKFTDTRDNKVYKVVEFGTQTWMAENLNYTPSSSGSKCPDNTSSNCTIYGRQYNWATARTACPSGWHLPSSLEWTNLVRFVNDNNSGTKLKAKSGWNSNGNGTDSYGFAALPGGYVCYNCNSFLVIPLDTYPDIGDKGYWWTDTELVPNYASYILMSNDSEIVNYDSRSTSDMLSVRCVKN